MHIELNVAISEKFVLTIYLNLTYRIPFKSSDSGSGKSRMFQNPTVNDMNKNNEYPVIEWLTKRFFQVDVDECDDIAMDYNISSMPTFVFVKNKNVIHTFSGANYEKLKQNIEELK